MLEGKDLRNIAVYLYNVTIEDFAKDVYNKDYNEDKFYITEKFNKKNNRTMDWIGELDGNSLTNLAESINKKDI